MTSIRRARRRLLFHLLRVLAVAVAGCGFQRLRPVGRGLGSMAFWLSPRRRILEKRVVELLGAEIPAAPARILKTAYRENTRAILEIIALYASKHSARTLAAACEIDGLDQLDQLTGGAILLGTHSGNGVLLPIRLAQLGYPVSVAVRESNKISPAFFLRGLGRYGVQALDVGGGAQALRSMMRALNGGNLLYILMDQGAKRGGQDATIFGQRIPLPGGPALLARRCGVPVIPAPTIAADPLWRFELQPPLWPHALGQTIPDHQHLAWITEQQIRRHPELWAWQQRRWISYPSRP